MTDLDSNGNPLQYSCLENPRDGGAWWIIVYGVSQSQTWLKWLSSSSRQHIKKQRHYLLTNVQLVKAMFYVLFFFPVFMCGCESWTIEKAEHQRIDAFELWGWREKTLESPLDCKEIQSVNPKGNQSWIFIGRTDAEAEIPILWPLDAKKCLIGKGHEFWKDWRQEEKGMTEDEMVGWYHWLDVH